MGVKDDNKSVRPRNYRDVLIMVRVFADEVPEEIIKTIISSDIDEVMYKVDDKAYRFEVKSINFMDRLN
tara:strand:- start:253 stop:459 length:207 start_codon:yes stop_codon:yes gene_type:complete